MKTFSQFIFEVSNKCNNTEEGVSCPIHGNKSCSNSPVKELEKKLKKTNNTSYDSIDTLMRDIMKKHNITAKNLHNSFVDKHGKTPDDWIKSVKEEYTRIQSRGTTYTIILNWRGKSIISQMFFPQFNRPSKAEVAYEIRKVYPNAIILSFYPSIRDTTKPLLFSGEK